ncbi:MAG: polysaccharide biosynthesis C-terminal domain-containing protein [Bacteroidetes bacterium]|nr:polysaccharide biosynthesis C-terminal domain-containing protein [Bacteroidota bacterium]
MNREFLLNAVFLIFVNVLIKPFYVFGIERTVQERVGPEEYGLYATLFSFTFLLFMVNDFGIHYFNNRNIARHPQLIGKLLPNTLMLKGLLTVAYLLLVFVAAYFRGFEPGIFHLIFFIAVNHVLISLTAFLRSNISGLGMYRTDSLVSTLDKLLLIGVCAVLLWGNVFPGTFQIEWFIHAQNLTWGLTALTAFFFVKNVLRQPLRFRPNWPLMLLILKKSAPYALAVFLMTAYTRFDIVILEWLLPDGRHEAGIYAAAYRLLDAFNMAGFLFAGLLLPMFSTMLRREEIREQGDRKGRPNNAGASPILKPSNPQTLALLRFALQLIWGGTVTVAVACFFFRTELMLWLYPQTATPYYGEVLAFIILTLVPFSGIFVYSTLLTANDSLRKMNGLFLVGIAVNLALNLLLIPSQKAVGAGMSAFFTQSIVLVGMMVLAKKELGLPFEPRQFLKIAAFVTLVCSANWALYQLPGVGWLLKFGAGITAGLLLAFVLRMVNLKTMAGLVKK